MVSVEETMCEKVIKLSSLHKKMDELFWVFKIILIEILTTVV